MARRPVLLSGDPHAPFPDVSLALRQPDGLLAVGGDLSVPRLLAAYRSGMAGLWRSRFARGQCWLQVSRKGECNASMSP